MFDIGWTELLVVSAIAIIVVGPKDLPRMLRSFGQTVGKLRRMANEFQSTFNDALREAEKQADIDEMRKSVEEVGNFDPLGDIKKSIEPVKKAGDDLAKDVNKRLDTGERPAKAADTPAEKPAEAKPAEAKPAVPEKPAAAASASSAPSDIKAPAASSASGKASPPAGPAASAPEKAAPGGNASAKGRATKSPASKTSAKKPSTARTSKASSSKSTSTKSASSRSSAAKTSASKAGATATVYATKKAAGTARAKTAKAKSVAPAGGGDTSDAGSTS